MIHHPRRQFMPPLPRRRSSGRLLVATALVVVSLAGYGRGLARAQGAPSLSANASVFASGLNNPRGLAFGPDGRLYVAEGGTGGALSTVGHCTQAPMPAGPYSAGYTARISTISGSGARSTVVDKLPSDQMNAAASGAVSGVAAVTFLGGHLYALLTAAGCSHGLAGTVNAVIRVGAHGAWTRLADLSTFTINHPVASVDPDDYEADGTWYGLAAAQGNLYVTGANHQELDRITPAGGITRLVDFSTLYPGMTNWQGPTALAAGPGRLYVGFLTRFPTVVGASNITQVSTDGQVQVVAAGLTAVVGVAQHQGQLYVLETMASGLSFPTAMTFGPDGALYVSNLGFGTPPGAGQIVRVRLPAVS